MHLFFYNADILNKQQSFVMISYVHNSLCVHLLLDVNLQAGYS